MAAQDRRRAVQPGHVGRRVDRERQQAEQRADERLALLAPSCDDVARAGSSVDAEQCGAPARDVKEQTDEAEEEEALVERQVLEPARAVDEVDLVETGERENALIPERGACLSARSL